MKFSDKSASFPLLFICLTIILTIIFKSVIVFILFVTLFIFSYDTSNKIKSFIKFLDEYGVILIGLIGLIAIYIYMEQSNKEYIFTFIFGNGTNTINLINTIIPILTLFLTIVAWRTYNFIKNQWRQDNLHKLREQIKGEQVLYTEAIDKLASGKKDGLTNEEIDIQTDTYLFALNRWLNDLDFLAMYILDGSVPEPQAKELFRHIYKTLVCNKDTRDYIFDIGNQGDNTFAYLIKLVGDWKINYKEGEHNECK